MRKANRNKGAYWLVYPAGFFLAVLIILNSFFFILNDREFYAEQIEANKVIVGSNELNATFMLIDYLNGKTSIDDFGDFFSEKERIHLDDVKRLIDTARYIAFALVAVLAAFFIWAAYSRDFIDLSLRALKSAGFTCIGLLLFAVIMLLNFNSSFITFHEILFTNDYWVLDPATDHLIQLFPQAFFEAFALRMVLFSAFSSAVLIAAGYLIRYANRF